jgi:alkylation response protein AidB-like acyl-CoA dehydrogenase
MNGMRNSHLVEPVGPPAERWVELQNLVAERADENERNGAPSTVTMALLRKFGVFHAVLPVEQGGWGVGLWRKKPLALWTINRRLGFADPSIAHCLQVHNNTLDMICEFASPALKARACAAALEGGIFGAWGASRFEAPSMMARRDGNDRFVVSGHAFFCTNAGFATHVATMVACPEDADIPYNGMRVALIELDRPGINVIPDWWNRATGMVATASHRVEFTDVRFSCEDIILDGRDIQKHSVQTRFMPQFASNFLGMMERMLAEARDSVARAKSTDALARARLGQLAVLVARVEALMRETARIWVEEPESAPWMANVYRSEAGHALIEALDHTGILLGGAGMMSNFGFSKIARDAMTMVRHENTDRIMDTLGSLCVGDAAVDLNYSGRVPVKV